MGKRIYSFIATFLAWMMVLIVQKPLFMLYYNAKLPADSGIGEYLKVIFHGLPLDLSLAGYLTCVPAILLLASVWTRHEILIKAVKWYTMVAALIVAMAFTVNLGLYEYWGFPLDSTPVFYFFSSPKDALASITWLEGIAGVFSLAASTAFISWFVYKLTAATKYSGFNDSHPCGNRISATIVLAVLSGLLFFPIRGGLTVSTTNTGKAYFSEHAILNHAAVDPLFSLIESLSHQEDFADQYRFMDDKEAEALFSAMTSTSSAETPTLLTCKQPDIYIFVLESFSMELWKTNAIPKLRQAAEEGLFFTNFYANSFRTDRGLVAILSGFPAQPTMSIMKYPKKTAKLPSLAARLKANGYGLKYYYGGDADFTNMRSYLVGQGFEDIVSDKDFPMNERMSKWGAPDGYVFARMLNDLKGGQKGKPMLRVLQTSSSHEPFDVPFHRLADERLNAFAYADSCIGDFVTKLKATDRWSNSLLIFVPDHQGCIPRVFNNSTTTRYHIPMIWTGGAIAKAENIATYGSQHDIAATILGQLGIAHADMLFSKDMFCPSAPHFAYFTNNDLFGMITPDNALIYDNKSGKTAVDEGTAKGQNMRRGKAYLQKLYDYIANL